MNKLLNYISLSRQELKKVVWPTKKEVRQHTIMVVVLSIGVAIFLGIVDYLLNIIVANFF